MTEKKTKPEIRFKGFSDEWIVEKIENVFSIFNGYAFSSIDSVNNGAHWVKIADVGIQEMKIDNLTYLPNNYIHKYSDYILKEGDYVIALTRPILSGELKIARINKFFNNSLLNQRVGKLVSNANHDYVYYLLQNKKLINYIENNIAGTDPPNLAPKEINNIKIGLPSLTEQSQIGTLFQKLDNLITLHQRNYDKLVILKKAMLEKMFPKDGADVPEIRFKGFSDEWEEKRLGDVSRITTGSSNRQDSSLDGVYTFFDRSDDIRTSNTYLFDCEVIIVAGEGSDFIPKYFVGKFDLHQRSYAIMNFDNVIGKFIFFYIHLFREYFLEQAVGSTVKSLRLPMFQKMPIKCPQEDEQTKIGTYFQNLDKLISLHQKELEKLKNIKKACLEKLFV